MATTSAALTTQFSLLHGPSFTARQRASVEPSAARCLACRLLRPALGAVSRSRKRMGVKARSSHEEEGCSADPALLESRDETKVGLSRRATLVGGALLGAAVVGSSADIREAQAADEPAITRKVFFDITVDGEPIGRFVVGLYGDDVPIGTARFADLAAGKQSVGYRRRPIELITPNSIQGAALISLYPGGNRSAGTPITGGETTGPLLNEMEAQRGRMSNSQYAVSLLIVDSKKEAAKQKLVAADGKFYVVEESSRPELNGTAFSIATVDAPELDKTNLVIGRVIDGMEVVRKIANLPVNRDNSDSGFFKVGKLIGDRRAIVAERGFNRPFAKVMVASCGELASQE
ncbi:cyclophilin-like peptidyl-prolyl cis-trans isomerase family protein [Klebsormidium nitens]|uniref:Cyclophilin-like peptidyl-prolyl cis-trans isomerase family protein n=1 Tax=Klebsormidium nitens TaxID=105231 RepID=A0A1Y1HMU2_KLENI|nr:cyclophilin-like peptidyl-prolyl cis-trans isomerase family protein [Klebsormidium nitens]|eukprot:GAQ77867.1 cyclophilin-like peptidyl-prolyl cis-trans isomerase family protein [Klebsormidium nitens]